MKSVLDFLLGKDPDIFDDKGQVRHKFPEKKWQNWQDRFKKSEYNWRKHSATELNTDTKIPQSNNKTK